ncbi:hypothetical protein ONE63_004289 [Megalurothrips usitatus]|uniref:Uncharacterized protein n=1 Tax=Megalurothrips usitatus TaxID=439358 RepID=A0AAV7X696_9NEOP|nr:hypothetical protein ONE63_004289 [Megalurothrips usitatus]
MTGAAPASLELELPGVCQRLDGPVVSPPLDRDGEWGALQRASARLRRVEQWLLYELRHGRAERLLLERLIQLKDEDLVYERNRLQALQEQVDRLKGELGECRRELLDRQKQYTRVYVENVRLQADKYVCLCLRSV